MTLDPQIANQLQQQGRKVEREVGRTNVPAVLGDGQGNVSLPGNKKWYYYREVLSSDANGTVYSAPSIALAAGKNLPEESGTDIIISFYGEIAVVDGIDPIRYAANGKNARALNPQSAYNKFVLMEYAVIGYAVPVGTQTTRTMEVYVKPFYYVNEDGDYKTAGDVQADLVSKIPAAVGGLDQHVIVGLFLKSDNTFELVSSTPKLKTDTLTHTTDVAEVFAGASARAMPIRTWRVYTGQTLLSITDEFSDIRLWLPTMRRKHNFAATVAPTVNDDIDDNYEVTSLWFDATNDKLYICYDSTSGAADWRLALTNAVDVIEFNTSYTETGSEIAGSLYHNKNFYTLNYKNGLNGVVLQLNQETVLPFYNNTGSTITNGSVIRPTGGTLVGGIIYATFELAKADIWENCEGTLLMATHDIENNSVGLGTKFGFVNGIDTSGYSPGDELWLSATIAGAVQNTAPGPPYYDIKIGGPSRIDASNGQIGFNPTTVISDTTLNFFNGTFREPFDFRVSSNGTTVTGSIEPSNGHDDMTPYFNAEQGRFDTSPAATITLTHGTDTAPVTNYVYIPESTGVLTLSTTSWPSGIQFIPVAEVLLVSAATTKLEGGARRNQNWNNETFDTTTNQGHLEHIGRWIRFQPASYVPNTGTAATLNGTGTLTDVYVASNAGDIMQFHQATFPAQDMTQYTIDAVSTGSKTFTISGDGDLTSTFYTGKLIHVNDSTGNDGAYTVASTNYSAPDFVITVSETIPSATADGTIGDIIIVINESTGQRTTTNLNDITSYSDGSSIPNNEWFSIVVWGIRNKSGEPSWLVCNLPSDGYNSEAGAIADGLNHSNYTIPDAYNGVGFLIARFTMRKIVSGFTYNAGSAFQDLRKSFPNTLAGGGGSTGLTEFIQLADTPVTYSGQGGKPLAVNAAENAVIFATFKKHVIIKPDETKLGTTPPTAAVIGNFSVLQFTTAATETIYSSFHLPTDWSTDTDVVIRVYWAPADGTAGDVVWQMTYAPIAAEANEVISATGTTTTITDSTQSLQDELLQSGDMTITGTGLSAEDTIGLKIFRDPAHGSDTYANSASLVHIEIEYTADKLGEAV
jgi:hypothetical protein